MTLNDLEPPKRGFSEFFTIFGCMHILTLNYDVMAGDRPRQPAYDIFSIQRRF